MPDLAQSEADELLACRKSFTSPYKVSLGPGVDVSVRLQTDVGRIVVLDITRSRKNLKHLKLQLRAADGQVLTRLCIDGGLHSNPDGESRGRTHIHRYREGSRDSYADPLDAARYPDTTKMLDVLDQFLEECNIDRAGVFATQGVL